MREKLKKKFRLNEEDFRSFFVFYYFVLFLVFLIRVFFCFYIGIEIGFNIVCYYSRYFFFILYIVVGVGVIFKREIIIFV